MENEQLETTETIVETETTPETQVEKIEETKPLSKNDLLRDMSKEYGVNLFDAEGLAKFKEYQEAQKTEQERLQEKVESFNAEKLEFNTKIEAQEARIAGLELGIDTDKLNDAIALAKNNIKEGQSIRDGLKLIKEKYGDTFGKTKGTNTEVVVGTQQAEDMGTQVELDPALAAYLKQKDKKTKK